MKNILNRGSLNLEMALIIMLLALAIILGLGWMGQNIGITFNDAADFLLSGGGSGGTPSGEPVVDVYARSFIGETISNQYKVRLYNNEIWIEVDDDPFNWYIASIDADNSSLPLSTLQPDAAWCMAADGGVYYALISDGGTTWNVSKNGVFIGSIPDTQGTNDYDFTYDLLEVEDVNDQPGVYLYNGNDLTLNRVVIDNTNYTTVLGAELDGGIDYSYMTSQDYVYERGRISSDDYLYYALEQYTSTKTDFEWEKTYLIKHSLSDGTNTVKKTTEPYVLLGAGDKYLIMGKIISHDAGNEIFIIDIEIWDSLTMSYQDTLSSNNVISDWMMEQYDTQGDLAAYYYNIGSNPGDTAVLTIKNQNTGKYWVAPSSTQSPGWGRHTEINEDYVVWTGFSNDWYMWLGVGKLNTIKDAGGYDTIEEALTAAGY